MSEENTELMNLPPSAKLVYKVLEYEEILTQKELAEETLLSPRTVRYACQRLEELDVVEKKSYVADARQNLYQIKNPEPANSE